MWLAGESAPVLLEGALGQGIRGIVLTPGAVRRAWASYPREVRSFVAGGPGDLYDSLARREALRLADLLAEIHASSKGEDGYVAVAFRGLGEEDGAARAVGWMGEVGRPNVMVELPASEVGLRSMERLLEAGRACFVSGVLSPAMVSDILARAQRAAVAAVPLVLSVAFGRLDGAYERALGQGTEGKAYPVRPSAAVVPRFLEAWERALEAWPFGRRPPRVIFDVDEGPRGALAVKDLLRLDVGTLDFSMDPSAWNAVQALERPEEPLPSRVTGAVLRDLEARGITEERVASDLRDQVLGAREEALARAVQGLREIQKRHGGVHLGPLGPRVPDALAALQEMGALPKLLGKDGALYGSDPELVRKVGNRMGWVDLPASMAGRLEGIRAFVAGVRNDGFTHALLLGMGGSSLAPLVFRHTFGVGPDGLDLAVLDSSSPDAVRRVARTMPLERTLVVVASKSGTTAEPNALKRHFQREVEARLGRLWPRAFAAVTDPDTPLDEEARREGWRKVFRNPPDLGGRYSALSYFGLVPLALLGHDPAGLLAAAGEVLDLAREGRGADNPALLLGALLGCAFLDGRDKVTFLADEEARDFPLWLEQLLAESTGKEGKGLLPVALEPIRDAYGSDRVFVAFRRGASFDLGERAAEGHPVLRFQIDEPGDLGREMMRFELGAALSGVLMGINPFDEPNVAESKANTRRILDGLAPGRRLTTEALAAQRAGQAMRDLLGGVADGGYVQVAAYLDPGAGYDGLLQDLRERLAHLTQAPITSGFGPRFLHSTGQYHKGGRPVGTFLQLVQDGEDLPIPGLGYGFGTLIRAQAEGDREALLKRRFPVLTVDLGRDPEDGLQRLLASL